MENDYAFTWLTDSKGEKKMLGQIELENFVGLTSMPQGYASAWSALEGLVGASYKPLLCVGKAVVHGTNYFFIAEQTLVTNPPVRRVVKLVVNELDGKYKLVGVENV